MSVRTHLTGLLAVALGASMAFAPAPSGSSNVDRIDVPCEVTGEDSALLVGSRDDGDLCGADLARTVDGDGVLVGLVLGLDVSGAVTPARDRVYSFSLESTDSRPWAEGCELRLEIGGIDEAELVRSGSCGSYGTIVESLLTDQAVDNAELTIAGGRLEVTFDLSVWDEALAELLTDTDSLTLEAAVNGYLTTSARGIVTRTTSTHGYDATGPLTVQRIGSAPSALLGDPCAEVSGVAFAADLVLCDGGVTAVLDEGGALDAVRLQAITRHGQPSPDHLTWSLGEDQDGCSGVVELVSLPDGTDVVTAGSKGCEEPYTGSSAIGPFTNYLLDALPTGSPWSLAVDVLDASEPCIIAAGRAAGIDLVNGTLLPDPTSMLIEPEGPEAAEAGCGTLPQELGSIAEDHGLTPDAVQAYVDHLAATLPGELALLVSRTAEGLEQQQVTRFWLDWVQWQTDTALHVVPGATVERSGDTLTVTIPGATDIGSVDDLMVVGRTFPHLFLRAGKSLQETMTLPGFTLGS